MAKKAKVKRDRSPGYNERQMLKQRARDDKRRLEKLEVAKLEAKQDRDPRGVDCSPASPLTEKEKEKKATGRPRKAQKLSLTGARGCAHQTSPLSLARSRARSLSCFLYAHSCAFLGRRSRSRRSCRRSHGGPRVCGSIGPAPEAKHRSVGRPWCATTPR